MAVFTYLKDGEISAMYLWRENLNNGCKEQWADFLPSVRELFLTATSDDKGNGLSSKSSHWWLQRDFRMDSCSKYKNKLDTPL